MNRVAFYVGLQLGTGLGALGFWLLFDLPLVAAGFALASMLCGIAASDGLGLSNLLWGDSAE